jgi:GPH family glycoside/pentoside/hexuronide:cation symporter
MSEVQEAGSLPPVRRLGRPTMLAYGFGAVAYGVKDFGFSTFLLFFFNQVMGLPASEVGLAILCALVLDALIDPLIGTLSDRTRSKWGRRHPWMYASALPIAIGWLLLWNPPELSHSAMLIWVFAFSVIVRSAVSAYEVPSQALSPELSADYDERTRIMAYRYLFGWAGGMAMLVASYGYFLAPHPGQETGLLNRESYLGFSICGAVAMMVAILVSALGTHHEIKHLPRLDLAPQTIGGHFRELGETVRNRAFIILMGAGICFYAAQGISFSLSNYLYTYVWGMKGADFMYLAGSLFVGVIGAFVLAPRLAKRVGKPVAAMMTMAGAALLISTPYLLRLVGLFPEPDSAVMLPLLFTIFAVNATCSVSSTILGASMMADVVEHSEVKTGRRSEGVFFAGGFFVQKCTTGLGIFLSGWILSGVGFPEGAAPGQVPGVTLDRLTIIFAGLYLLLGMSASLLYRLFPFGKAEHDARIEALAGGA